MAGRLPSMEAACSAVQELTVPSRVVVGTVFVINMHTWGVNSVCS